MSLEFEQNDNGMLQACIDTPQGYWSIISPCRFTMNCYEIAFVKSTGELIDIDDGDSIKRFDTEEEAVAFIEKFDLREQLDESQ